MKLASALADGRTTWPDIADAAATSDNLTQVVSALGVGGYKGSEWLVPPTDADQSHLSGLGLGEIGALPNWDELRVHAAPSGRGVREVSAMVDGAERETVTVREVLQSNRALGKDRAGRDLRKAAQRIAALYEHSDWTAVRSSSQLDKGPHCSLRECWHNDDNYGGAYELPQKPPRPEEVPKSARLR